MTDEDGKVRSLLIPVKNSTQEVEVFVDELPDDVNDIIDILRAEVAPLDVWLKFAVRGNRLFEVRGRKSSGLILCSLLFCVSGVYLGGVLQPRTVHAVPGDPRCRL